MADPISSPPPQAEPKPLHPDPLHQTPNPSPAKAPSGNPALRMLGLPNLPRKLPSRNWLLFWALSGALASAIIYDKREKKRATAKWRRLVEPLAREPLTAASQLPRKLTIYIEAPPGDGLRVAQDHFIEYVKPVLAASGLDWEFVQGRQQGDVRAAVAEKLRRLRMAHERPNEKLAQTDEAIVHDLRIRIGVPQYQGVKGDIVIGRHTWKEYVRGLHEGWLGPLDPPPQPELHDQAQPSSNAAAQEACEIDGSPQDDTKLENKHNKEEKPSRPSQPPPYNSPDDYEAATLPIYIADELPPSCPISFPHRLGFSQTFVRLGRFLNRRKLADDIGREVAAVCLAAYRPWREMDGQLEQSMACQHGEQDWPANIWKANQPGTGQTTGPAGPPKDTTWTSPMVLDMRIASRMRRFDMLPQDQERASGIIVPEEEVEGWIKGSLRSLWRWGAGSLMSKPRGPKVGNLDDD
ncbi:hypothetical protein CDD82_3555 [Ophiocordyceps australis]|uniref:Mitochondrial import inner membrane translocase subunit TIM54 n=1 Tax=Ophiocordyceps australis TaxID=1399860 RepID=A0A2C5ZDT1_9HYPO|nr:hypothetical protein CDD82_3555 [Ophiocordyceps australis]